MITSPRDHRERSITLGDRETRFANNNLLKRFLTKQFKLAEIMPILGLHRFNLPLYQNLHNVRGADTKYGTACVKDRVPLKKNYKGPHQSARAQLTAPAAATAIL